MNRVFSAKVFLLALLMVCMRMLSAHAMIGSKLNTQELSSTEVSKMKSILNTRVRADLSEHFEERVNDLAVRAAQTQENPAMSRATQAVLLKGAYEALIARSPIPVSEAAFDRNLGKVLDWLAGHGIFPQGITLGVLARKTWGEGYTAGFNYGVEANFYLQNGKLMMTNYSLKGGQVGVGSAVSDVEFYFAFCFGSCYGGDPDGWYLGLDGNVAGGLGAGMFAEVGVDMSSLFSAMFVDQDAFSIQDLYEASTVYVGFGFEEGIGGEMALGLYHYGQIGIDTVLANPGEALDPGLISSQASRLRP